MKICRFLTFLTCASIKDIIMHLIKRLLYLIATCVFVLFSNLRPKKVSKNICSTCPFMWVLLNFHNARLFRYTHLSICSEVSAIHIYLDTMFIRNRGISVKFSLGAIHILRNAAGVGGWLAKVLL